MGRFYTPRLNEDLVVIGIVDTASVCNSG